MRYFLTSLVLLFLVNTALVAQADDHRAVITDSLEVYLQANYDKDYNKIMDMIYPKLFEIVSRETMIALFEGMDSEGIDFAISNGVIGRISDVVTHEQERFATVDYKMVIMMRYSGIEYESEETQNTIFEMMKGQYGADNVQRKDGAMYINTEKTMLAIAPLDSDAWKFIEKNDEQPGLMKDLVPQVILDAFAKQ